MLATPTADASPPALAVAARGLAHAIIVDANRVRSRPWKTAMVTASMCCGRTERHVYYRAAPGPYATYGAYELSVTETGNAHGGVIRNVTISEFPTTPQAPFFPDPLRPTTFSLSITHDSLRLNKDWGGEVEYHDDPPCSQFPAGGACSASSEGHPLTGDPRLVRAVTTQAMAVIEKAHRHEPISAENSSILHEIEG